MGIQTVNFHIKQNDRLPIIQATLRGVYGVMNLTGAIVHFVMAPEGSTTDKIYQPAVILDPIAGLVEYEWAVLDTDTVGYFNAEWRVTFASGKIQTFPNTGHIRIHVHAQV